MITVTKKDLIALGYGTSFSADIIRKAKKLMIEKGHTYYQSRKLDRVPKEAVEECSCTVEKHKAKQRQPALPLFRSQGNAIEKFIAVCYT